MRSLIVSFVGVLLYFQAAAFLSFGLGVASVAIGIHNADLWLIGQSVFFFGLGVVYLVMIRRAVESIRNSTLDSQSTISVMVLLYGIMWYMYGWILVAQGVGGTFTVFILTVESILPLRVLYLFIQMFVLMLR